MSQLKENGKPTRRRGGAHPFLRVALKPRGLKGKADRSRMS